MLVNTRHTQTDSAVETRTAAHESVGEAEIPATAGLRIGDVVDNYLIDSELGCGAAGRVFAAVDHALQRKVAIKVLHASVQGLHGSSAIVARSAYAGEAQACERYHRAWSGHVPR